MKMSEKYQHLKRFIERDLRKFTENRKKALKHRYLWEIFILILIPVVLSIIGYILSGVVSVIMIVILALINLFDRLRKGFTILVSYHSDIEKWDEWYDSWLAEINAIRPEDEERIQEIRKEIKNFFKKYRERIELPD